MSQYTIEQEIRLMKELEQYDTPTVTNAVATYPGNPTCLELYSPWDDNWYTDTSLKLMFPELGRRCGYAVTCVYGLPDPGRDRSLRDVLWALKEAPLPSVLLIKQDFPDRIKDKVGLCGGNMSTAFRSLGCIAIVSDGPSRDLEEVRNLGVQYMLTGVSAGHGPFTVKEVNTPVHICGMDAVPGDIIHMDVNGAVKFPRDMLGAVVENCRAIAADEEIMQARMAASDDPDAIFRYIEGDYGD